MSQPAYLDLCAHLAATCKKAGFDLLQPLQVGWYNNAVTAEYRLPDFGDATSLAVLIGNTRALWPRFCATLDADAELGTANDPLDRYTEIVVQRALQDASPHRREVRFAHEPPPRRVAMQRLAHVSGMAYLSPSFLSVHPVYGPWIALRAVVVLDIPGPPGPPPVMAPKCDCQANCLPHLQIALAKTREAATQRSTQDHADNAQGAHDAPGEDWRAHWQAWLAVRDACPVGCIYRYGEAQIRYHYANDKSALKPDR